MTSVIDAHVHIWDARRVVYPWLDDCIGLPRVVALDDSRAELDACGITGLVLVQAADDDDDTELMLAAARTDQRVAGIVAWAPMRDPSSVETRLDRWGDEPVVGLRHLVHREADPDFLRDAAVHETLSLLGSRRLTFDVCAETLALLSLVPDLAARHSDTTFVVDHLAKPPIRDRGWQPWADQLAAAAALPNVVVKLSGLNTTAAPGWTGADFVPYVEHALDCFGPDRMMFGGDWPFALLAASCYTEVWNAMRSTLHGLSLDERDAILAGTARRVYGLDDVRRRDQPGAGSNDTSR